MAFNFARKISDFKKMKKDLPKVIANMAKRHYVDSFRKGGFTDVSFNPWKARKRGDRSDRRVSNSNAARAILVKTGHLKNSIRVRFANFDKIEIGAYGVPYGVFHNSGTNKLPKRQFIGRSRTLERKLRNKINQEMKKILKK